MEEAGEKHSGRGSEPGSQPSSGIHPDTEVEVECLLHARPPLGVSEQLAGAQQGAPTADLAAGPAFHSPGFPDALSFGPSLKPSSPLSKLHSSFKAQLKGCILHEASMLFPRLKKKLSLLGLTGL